MLPTPDTGTSPRGHGRRGGRPGNGHQSGHDLDAAVRALPPPEPPQLPDAGRPQAGAPGVAWGPYETAIRRWEHNLRCAAPPPAEPGPGQRPRLAAGFAEWLMGLSLGVKCSNLTFRQVKAHPMLAPCPRHVSRTWVGGQLGSCTQVQPFCAKRDWP